MAAHYRRNFRDANRAAMFETFRILPSGVVNFENFVTARLPCASLQLRITGLMAVGTNIQTRVAQLKIITASIIRDALL